ncbi:MAG: hypothetical protein IKE42_28445 [Aquamicrobium sp.]|nr:hypothetical protein [Aquamicrobium sp.]
MTITKNEFRKRVREAMRLRGLSYEQLDHLLERGSSKISLHYPGGPTEQTIARYAVALGVSPAFLRGKKNIEARLREVAAGDGPAVQVGVAKPRASPSRS